MEATLRTTKSDGQEIKHEIKQDVKLYRSVERNHRTVIDTGDELFPTDIRCGEVSRKNGSNGKSYIEIFKQDEMVYLKDYGSTNDTFIKDAFGEDVLTNGERYPIQKDCVLKLAPNEKARVEIKIEKEAKKEAVDATWEVVSAYLEAFEPLLETNNASRIDEFCEELDAYLNAIQSEEVVNDEMEDLYDEFEEFRRALAGDKISQGNENNGPIEKGKRVCNGLKAQINQYSISDK